MIIIISTGGSGGHLFPAIQVAQKLKERGHKVTFVGTFDFQSERLSQEGFSVISLNTKGIRSQNILVKIVRLALQISAIFKSFGIINQIKPDIIVGFGGYSSFPVVCAGCLMGKSTLIHEQNVVPGLANKILSRFVRRVAISFQDSAQYFAKEKTVLTGCPCKVSDNNIQKDEALKILGLQKNRKTISVFGGSKGSTAINKIFTETMDSFSDRNDLQVIHLTGKNDYETIQNRFKNLSLPYVVYDFYDNMNLIYKVSDLIISRGGACTVTEIINSQVESLLIPYPHAGGHQLQNVKPLLEKNAATCIEENELSARWMAGFINKFMDQNGTGVDKSHLHLLQIKNATHNIVAEIEKFQQ